jgi:hypothetical protein
MTGSTPTDGEALMTLRGAAPGLDVGRVGQAVVGLCLVALAVSVVIFFVGAVHKNSQIADLRAHGVAVPFTVTGCLGLLGGSGSNAAGYTCRGTFTVDGHRYNEPIPGNADHPPGTVLRAVTVPGDPALVRTARDLAGERTSAKVYVFPTVLLLVLLLLTGVLLVRRRLTARTP